MQWSTRKKNLVSDLLPFPTGLLCAGRGPEQQTMAQKVHERGRAVFTRARFRTAG